MTNPVALALRRTAVDLAELDQPWALIGGLAVSVRAEPRTTRDVDVMVAISSDPDAERLIFQLQQRGYRVMAILEQKAAARLATARLQAPMQASVIVDLLFASTGVEADVVSNAEPTEVLPGLVIPVATTGDLMALKVLARDDRQRPQDWDDIRALLREATPQDVARTREMLRLIEQRGFNRGRHLEDNFQGILEELSIS